jgi:predicted  nucleic acid-binding Zn-ribbon protein
MLENGHTLGNGHTLFSRQDGESGQEDIKEGIDQIRQYLEVHVQGLVKDGEKKDNEIRYLKEELQKAKQHSEGNSQLINKLLGELSKLHNDIDWYKRTYEKRSLLGTIREKVFRKH